MTKTKTKTRTIELTNRELTLIRVALIGRLDKLYGRDDCVTSYNETLELLKGKLSIEILRSLETHNDQT